MTRESGTRRGLQALRSKLVFPERRVGFFSNGVSESLTDPFAVDWRLVPTLLSIQVLLGSPICGNRPVLLLFREKPGSYSISGSG